VTGFEKEKCIIPGKDTVTMKAMVFTTRKMRTLRKPEKGKERYRSIYVSR